MKVWAIYQDDEIVAYTIGKANAEKLARMYNKYDRIFASPYVAKEIKTTDPKIGIMFHVGLDDNGRISNVFVVTEWLIKEENIIEDNVTHWGGSKNGLHVCVYAKSPEEAEEKAKALFDEYKK